MSASHLEPLLQRVERRAVVTVLRSHPEWTLERLIELLCGHGSRSALLRNLTLGELISEPSALPIRVALDGGPPIDLQRRQAAIHLEGADFDECVAEILAEARGRAVAASYISARLGGPRWKLQSSLRRLVAAGLVERSGTTSATRYRFSGRHVSKGARS